MRPPEVAALMQREREIVELGAEAAYDAWYSVTPETSQNAYTFEKSEDLKDEWRAVVRAIFRAIQDAK